MFVEEIKNITNLLPAEAWATYIIGLLTIAAGLFGARYALLLNKKNAVFQQMSDKLADARNKLSTLNSSKNAYIDELARVANQFTQNPPDFTKTESYDSLLKELDKVHDVGIEHIRSLYGPQEALLEIIKDIEKSTLLKGKTKKKARILFYEVDDHFKLVNTANQVLNSFQVIPTTEAGITITPQIFNNFVDLLNLLYERHDEFMGFLNDLEVAIHNDLVSRVYGKAQMSDQAKLHLGDGGLQDSRQHKPLL